MDDLIRTRMHEALGVELPDIGLRARIMRSLPADTTLERARRSVTVPVGFRRELAAGIAALLLAAIVIGSFAYIRAVSRPHTVTPPVTTPSPNLRPPSPVGLTLPLNVDPATPVILFNDPANSNQVDGMTWDGQSAGRITQIPNAGQSVCTPTATGEDCTAPPWGNGAPPLTNAQASNPAGTVFVAVPYFYDRSGKAIATLSHTAGPYADQGVGLYFVGTWADDGTHYCQVVPIFGGTSAATGTLQLTTPGGTPRDVVRRGLQAAGENTLQVTACSVLADRAVVVQAEPSGPGGRSFAQYWVVQLSTGKVLWTRDLHGTGVANLVPSVDGRYVAEVQPAGTTTVYGANGSVAGHVKGFVQAFSWDGSEAVVVSGAGQASVVRWAGGAAVWSEPPGEGLSGFQVEPGGTSIAIQTVNGTLYLVPPDGHAVAQTAVHVYGLLACDPKSCTTYPQPGSAVMQVLPQLLVGDTGWADGPQRTTDGGLHWKDASPPSPANRTKGGNSSFFLDANHAWVTVATAAAGQPSASQLVIFGTTDGGQTWNQGSVPISGAATESASIDFADAQHGWVITDSGPTAFDQTTDSMVNQPVSRAVYTTADGGRTWNQVVSAREGDGSVLGSLALRCYMGGVTFANLKDGWVTWGSSCGIGPVGKNGPGPQAPTTSQVAVTHDGGRTWQAVDLPSFPTGGGFICTVHPPVFTSNQGVLPVDCGGIGGPGFSAVYVTNDGHTWSERKLPFWSQQLDFVDAFTGWTLNGVDLYRTTDGGRTWTVVRRFATEQNVNGLKFVDAKVGFALTARYSADGTSGFSTMWKTTDGGVTWSAMSTVANGGNRCC